MIVGYASRTGTKRNLDALRSAGWKILVSAKGVLRPEGFPYAIDNGAWTSHQSGEPFDMPAFEKVVDLLGVGADWIVAPDIVAGGKASLEFSVPWLARLEPIAPVLIAVQDGMEPQDIEPLLGARVGIFLGGTREWKVTTMAQWGLVAKTAGCYYHVGRVNSARRIYQCIAAGADSFDGTSASKFAVTLPNLDRARRMRQTGLPW